MHSTGFFCTLQYSFRNFSAPSQAPVLAWKSCITTDGLTVFRTLLKKNNSASFIRCTFVFFCFAIWKLYYLSYIFIYDPLSVILSVILSSCHIPVIVAERWAIYFIYIHLRSSVCHPVCHPVILSYSCHSCGTLSYSLCFSNQTDQGDETEGLEREG